MRTPTRTASAAGRALALAVAAGLCGCAPAPDGPDAAPAPLGPGACLLHHLDGASRLERSPGNLPERWKRWRAAANAWTIVSDDWSGSLRGLVADPVLARALGLGEEARWWHATIDGLTAGAPLAITRDGRRLPAVGSPLVAGPVFVDRDAGVALVRTPGGGGLSALASSPPPPVRARVELTAAHAPFRLDPSVTREARPVSRVERVRLGHESRPAWSLPAPGRVRVPARLAPAVERLRVAVGVLDAGGSDGVTFALDIVGPEGTRRAWTRHVRPDEGWVTARVPLAGAEALDFVTGPGPAGDATLDYAVWADLVLEGETAPPERPHVLLVDVDTWRADAFGPEPTPRLHAWARSRATVFTDALAAASWTLPATGTLLTGSAPRAHGLVDAGSALAPDLETLAERLRAAGYETRAATAGGFCGPEFGFDRGFDVYVSRPAGDLADWHALLEACAPEATGRPVFAFLQTYMVHAPYRDDPQAHAPGYDGPLAGRDVTPGEVLEPVRSGRLVLDEADQDHVRRLYRAGVRRLDAALGGFLEAVEERLRDAPRLVVVTSDHGEELFEHGSVGHGHALWDEVVRVPLIVRFPEGDRVGRSAAPVGGLAVAPTILEAAGLATGWWPSVRAGGVRGTSLGLWADRGTSSRRLLVLGQGGGEAVWEGAHKLWLDAEGRARLFDLAQDPGEREDRAARDSERARVLRDLIEARRERRPRHERGEGRPLPPEVVAQLRELGYVSDR